MPTRTAHGNARLHRPRRRRDTASRGRRATSIGAMTPTTSAGTRAPGPSTTSPGTRVTRTSAGWRERAAQAGMAVTPVIDRDYFLSIYFREPQGILFEIATSSPGFAVDEDPDRLGEELPAPSQHEHLRAQLERLLTPLTNPRGHRAMRPGLSRTPCGGGPSGPARPSPRPRRRRERPARACGRARSTPPPARDHAARATDAPRVARIPLVHGAARWPSRSCDLRGRPSAAGRLSRRDLGAHRHRARAGPCSRGSRWGR